MPSRTTSLYLFMVAAGLSVLLLVNRSGAETGQQANASQLAGSALTGSATVGSFPFSNMPQGTIPQGTQTSGNASMLMSSYTLPGMQQQIVLVDTSTKTMSVYTIAPDTGVISLRSVRRLDADFGLEEFNGSDPSPSKVRSILTPR